VVLQVPSARTKYVVAEDGETPSELPVPTGVPPQEPEYQFHDAPVPRNPPETEIVVASPLHVGFTLAEALAGSVDCVFTFTVTIAQLVLLQVP
jgi:hypothetical protein